MSASSETPWYRLGYALERARRQPTASRLRSLGERLSAFRDEGKDAGRAAERPDREAPAESEDGGAVFDDLIVGGAAAVAVKLLRAWPARHPSGWGQIIRGAAAGAGATLLREFTAPLLRGRFEAPVIEDGLGGRLVSGAARGALFGGFIDPRLPGPPALKGAVYGTAEYFAAPWGGLPGLLGSVAPWSRIPGLKSIVGDASAGEESWIEYVVFGMALALLSGADVDLAPLLDADDDVLDLLD